MVYRLLLILILLASPVWGGMLYLSNTQDIEDTRVVFGSNDNFGLGGYMSLQSYGGDSRYYRILIRARNLSDSIPAGASIIKATFKLFCYAHTDNKGGSAYRLFKPWVEQDTGSAEGGVTYYDWGSPDYEWATADAQCAYDAGIDNSADDGICGTTTADRTATPLDTAYISGINWYSWDITSLATEWYAGTANEEGIIIIPTSSAGDGLSHFVQIDAANTDSIPQFIVWYRVAGANYEDIWPADTTAPDQWAAFGGNKVAVVTDGFDENYIFENTDEEQQRFTLNDPVAIESGDTIDSVKTMWRAMENGNPGMAQTFQYVGVSANSGSIRSLDGAWTDYEDNFALAPGGGAWTLNNLNNLQLEAQCKQVKTDVRVTELWARVYYTVAGGAAEVTARRRNILAGDD